MNLLLWLFVWLLIALVAVWIIYTAPWPSNMPPLLRWAVNVIIAIFMVAILIALLSGNLTLPGISHPLLK